MMLVESDGAGCEYPQAISLKLSWTRIYHHYTRKQGLGEKKKKSYGEWWETEGNRKWLKRNVTVTTNNRQRELGSLLNICDQSSVQGYTPPNLGRQLSQCPCRLSNYPLWWNVAWIYITTTAIWWSERMNIRHKVSAHSDEGMWIKCDVDWMQSHIRSEAGQENIHVSTSWWTWFSGHKLDRICFSARPVWFVVT